jgi:hypothetical protein
MCMPRRDASRALALIVLGLLWEPGVQPLHARPGPPTAAGLAQAADTLLDPADTFRDPGAQALILRARAARQREVEGIDHYEAQLRQRAYLGLRAATFRRERGILEEERVARVRWESSGDVTIAWTGARRAIPFVAGMGDVDEGVQRDLARDLLRSSDPGPALADPGDDRLVFGGNWALHPLADSAGLHYRFASGDTLRLGLPDGRTVVLLEARVEPREARFNLVAGSLWFDAEGGGLVRASYRPARAFDLELDEPEDASDIPGILKPIRAEIRYITVDYSFHEFRWWLPRRWAFEGEVQLGRLARFPITLEWLMEDYRMNEGGTALPGAGGLPAGWSRTQQAVRREGEATRYVTVLVPPAPVLAASPALGSGGGGTAPTAFTPAEIREVREVLEGLLPRELRPRPSFGWGLGEGMVRFNRVEGLSVGARAVLPLSTRMRLATEGRIGYADLEPNGEISLQRGTGEDRGTAITLYRRLQPSSEWSDPFSLASSLQAAIVGSDRAPYHRTLGVEASATGSGRGLRWEGRVFAERHRGVERGTRLHLFHPLTNRDMVPTQPVGDADLVGVAGGMRWQRGLDPRGLIASGILRGEATVGEVAYQRVSGSVALVHPLPGGIAGALEVGAGSSWGDRLPQRRFFLGGTSTIRALSPHALAGESFWFTRVEVGTGLPGFRLAAFGDLGWAGPATAWRSGVPVASVGAGASVLDGLLRVDLARQVRGGDSLRLHLYLDGLF